MRYRDHALGIDRVDDRGVQGFRGAPQFRSRGNRAAANRDQGSRRRAQPRCGLPELGRAGGRRTRQGPGAKVDIAGGQRDHVDRDLDMDRPGTAALEQPERPGQHPGQLLRGLQRVAETGQFVKHDLLAPKFVQAPLAQAELAAAVDGGNDQHGNRVGQRLAHRGGDVGHAGSGDHEAHAGLAGHPRITVGHESHALFMPRGHVADRRGGEGAVQLDRVHARYAEHGVDAVSLEESDQHFTAARHRSFLSGRRRSFSGLGVMLSRTRARYCGQTATMQTRPAPRRIAGENP